MMAAEEESSPCSLPTGFGKRRPWLVQATRGSTLTLVDPSSADQSLHEITVPEIEGKTCLGCVHDGGWLVMLDESTGECFLLSLSLAAGGGGRRRKVPLPPLRDEPFESLGTCVVLGSPGHPDYCTVVVSSTAGAEETFILHCRPGDQEWTRLVSPFKTIEFYSLIVSYTRKLLAFATSNNLVVIDIVDGVVELRRLGGIQGEAANHGTGHYRLVESCEDLFVVRIQEHGCLLDDGVLTDIAVYRLDRYGSESMALRKVESIGDHRAFLISGGYGFSCDAVEGEMQGNCVYLVWSCCDCERLYKFCLDDMTITFHQVLPQPTHPWCRAFWSVPPSCSYGQLWYKVEIELGLSSRPQPKKVKLSDDLGKHIEEEVQGTSWAPWHDLPLELLELVVSNLSLVDRLRFPAVCKSWSKVSNPVEPAKVWPWLMHCSKQDGTCKMLDPLRGKEYTLRIETLGTDGERHIFRSSKDGWVVVSGGFDDEYIFIINPFTGDLVVDPPTLERIYGYNGISFSSNPTSPDCLFFGISSSHNGGLVVVRTWRHGEQHWREQEFVYQIPFPVGHNNPVLFRGKFYCLGRKGNLGVFDPRSKEPNSAWKILDKPESIHAEMEVFGKDHQGREFYYLVELEGQLVSVFMHNAAEPPQVFRLDETKEAWVKVDDIGGAALFVDSRASYAVASPEGGHGNKIFFPRYTEDGKQAAFYDMESKMYCPSFYGLKQPLKCVWVVPSLHVDRTSS